MQKKINGWIVTLIIGAIITVMGLLPFSFNSTRQCSDGNPQDVPGSNCIIGAPIGPPLWVYGLVIVIIGATGLTVSSFRKKK